MRELEDPDPVVQVITEATNDHDAGMLPGWPDRYATWLVEGVRHLVGERAHCQSLLLEE